MGIRLSEMVRVDVEEGLGVSFRGRFSFSWMVRFRLRVRV